MDIEWFTIGIVISLALSFLYALVIAQQILLWFVSLLIVLHFYLMRRLVRAVETIAENAKEPETDGMGE